MNEFSAKDWAIFITTWNIEYLSLFNLQKQS